MEKPELSRYVDYRAFLKDWSLYIIQNEGQTWRTLTQYLEVDVGAWHKICSQELHLSTKLLPKILPKLKLSPAAEQEFSLLRLVAKSKTEAEAKENRHQLLQWRTAQHLATSAPELASGHKKKKATHLVSEAFFTSWIHPTVYSLFHIKTRIGSIQELSMALSREIIFPVSVSQIQASIELLISLKMLKLSAKNVWKTLDQNVKSNLDWNEGTLKSYHRETIDLALSAIDTLNNQDMNISTLTLRIPPQNLALLEAEITAFKERIKALADTEDSPQDQLQQLNIQLFPLMVAPVQESK